MLKIWLLEMSKIMVVVLKDWALLTSVQLTCAVDV